MAMTEGDGNVEHAESPAGASCACGAVIGPGGLRAGMDAATKQLLVTRLRRIEGQVRGVQRMIEEERWCPDVLAQVSSVQEALRGTARELLRNHLVHCAADAVRSGDSERAATVFGEVTELIFRSAR